MGVTPELLDHVEQAYHRLLGFLHEVLKTHRFIVGGRPTLPVISFMGPLLS